MRNMSFFLTQDQIRAQTKTVTRRLGWRFLKPGDMIQPVVKCRGLKRGQRVQKIGGPIRIISVHQEPLYKITKRDCQLEGFPQMSRVEFMDLFCRANNCCRSEVITRIKFDYD